MVDIALGNTIDLRDVIILVATVGGLVTTIGWLVTSVRNFAERMIKVETTIAKIETKLDILITFQNEKIISQSANA